MARLYGAEVEIDPSQLENVAERMAANADVIAQEIPVLLAEWEVQILNRRAPGVQVNGNMASTFLWNWTPEQRKAMYALMYARGEKRRGKRGKRGPRRRERPVLRPHLHDALRAMVDEYMKNVPVF